MYLAPSLAGPAPVTRVYVSPLAHGGGMLRVRLQVSRHPTPEWLAGLEDVASSLPVPPVIELLTDPLGVDLLTSLHDLLAEAGTPRDQEERLFGQVVPVIDWAAGA